MPGCGVPGCKNRLEQGFRLFGLPRGQQNVERRRTWLDLIGRGVALPQGVQICEAHFSADQFEQNRMDGKKPLRWDAIPNLLKPQSKDSSSSQELVAETTSLPERICSSDEIIDGSDELGDDDDVSKTEYKVAIPNGDFSTGDKRAVANSAVEKLQEANALLKERLKKELQQNRILRKRLTRKNDTYCKVFNKDQLTFLELSTHRGFSWEVDTFHKALRLYMACGEKGYVEIRKQHLPYPSIRTLQRKIETLDLKQIHNLAILLGHDL